jgi:hypothetical protein
VLRTTGIDLILGMDWMKQHRAMIQCQETIVVMPTPNRDRIYVDVVVQAQLIATMNQLNDDAN